MVGFTNYLDGKGFESTLKRDFFRAEKPIVIATRGVGLWHKTIEILQGNFMKQ
jgi:hypothetical protein